MHLTPLHQGGAPERLGDGGVQGLRAVEDLGGRVKTGH